jgi:TRAP transporter TAXI family solute receptor
MPVYIETKRPIPDAKIGCIYVSMRLRLAAFAAFGTLAGGIILSLMAATGQGRAQAARIPFLIATGPSGGTYFPVGQAIAGAVSNPPGASHCQVPEACGPPGLIASARTSDGAVANVLAVNAGNVDSGLAQADVVAEAEKGIGAFRKPGKQSHVRILAALFSEDVHLVVAARSQIQSVGDLEGKRVSLGAELSGTNVTARAVLAAYRLSERNVKTSHDSADTATARLQDGKLDAFFFVGATPVPLVSDLVSRGIARLVPIDGAGRGRLATAVPSIEFDRIAARTYAGTGAIETVRVRALWIVRDAMPPSLAYGVLRALYNPANRDDLDVMPATRAIRMDDAARHLPAPLHPGAMRFFRENGKI